MDDLHLSTASTARGELYKSPPLRRCHSWPPALSVGTFEFPAPVAPTPQPPRSLARPELDRTVSSGTLITAFENLASHSSSDLSLASKVSSVEVKKEGFRAVVARRWLQTKHALHEKAKLYREQHRARHHSRAFDASLGGMLEVIAHESARTSSLSKPGDKTGTATDDTSKNDSDKAQKDADETNADGKVQEREISERRDCYFNNVQLKDDMKKDYSKDNAPKGKDENALRQDKVTNSPHELSLTTSQFAVGADGERGRRAIPSSYLLAFSSQGELLYDAHQRRRKRKSRTLSGRRRSWRVPGEGIVTVFEETASIKEAVGCDDEEATLVALGCGRLDSE